MAVRHQTNQQQQQQQQSGDQAIVSALVSVEGFHNTTVNRTTAQIINNQIIMVLFIWKLTKKNKKNAEVMVHKGEHK